MYVCTTIKSIPLKGHHYYTHTHNCMIISMSSTTENQYDDCIFIYSFHFQSVYGTPGDP